MNRGGFSWIRFIGVSKIKSNISRKIGIPFTKSGRYQKIGRMITGNGCVINIAIIFFLWELMH